MCPAPLFVSSQNHFNVVLLMQDVENFKDHPSRKGKNSFHALAFQGFQKNFGSCKLCHGVPHPFEPEPVRLRMSSPMIDNVRCPKKPNRFDGLYP